VSVWRRVEAGILLSIGIALGVGAALHWLLGSTLEEAVVWTMASAAYVVPGAWKLLARTRPRLRDLRHLGERTVWYHSASFAPLSLVIVSPVLSTAIVVLLYLARLSPSAELLALCLLLPNLASALLASIALGLGCVRVLLARGRTVLLLSLGYCEGEFITDGRVRAWGFRTLAEFPTEREECPSLRVVVGYWPPGIHVVRIPDCRFLCHRTRGFCLLHGPEELSDRERAFKLARRWERLSAAYAALGLKEGGSPDPAEVEALAAVTEVSRRGLTVTYLGVEFPVGKLITSEEAWLGITLGTIPVAILVRDLLPPNLSPLSIPIAAPLAGMLLALPVAWRNRRVVKTGQWYRLPLRRDRVERLLPKQWGEDVGPMGSRRGGMITALWRVFNTIERKRRRASLC